MTEKAKQKNLESRIEALEILLKDMIALQMHAYRNTFPQQFEDQKDEKDNKK